MWTKVKAFLTVVGNDLADTWKRIKVFVIAIAGLVIYFEFTKIKDAIIAYAGKKEIDTTQKKDDKLAVSEDTNNKQADALVAEAAALPAQETPVDDDWYKKEKP
jgi:uncharacterized membrane protein